MTNINYFDIKNFRDEQLEGYLLLEACFLQWWILVELMIRNYFDIKLNADGWMPYDWIPYATECRRRREDACWGGIVPCAAARCCMTISSGSYGIGSHMALGHARHWVTYSIGSHTAFRHSAFAVWKLLLVTFTFQLNVTSRFNHFSLRSLQILYEPIKVQKITLYRILLLCFYSQSVH